MMGLCLYMFFENLLSSQVEPEDDLAICEADGEDDMLGSLGPHAAWRRGPEQHIHNVT